jgi:hypothetical protein
MTPLLMTTSAQPFSTGNSSMIPFRNSTWPRPIAVAAARERSSSVEVEAAARIDGDIPILGLDFIAERHRINW